MATTPVEHTPLTVADGRFVGDPVAPERPFRSLTEFDRLVAQYETMPPAAAMRLLDSMPAAEPLLPAPPPSPPPPPPERMRHTTLGQSRRRGVGGYRAPGTPPSAPAQATPDEAAAEPVTQDDPLRHEPPHDPPRDPPAGAPPPTPPPPPQPPPQDVPLPEHGPGHATPPRTSTPAESTVELRAHSCPDLQDANVLDALAGRLYRYVRTRLRAELLVDRERSGMLADPI